MIYEFCCKKCRMIRERFSHVSTDEDPPCEICGEPQVRMASMFNVVFTGRLAARYNDPKRENSQQEGYWDYRVRSSISGQREPVFLETWDDVRAFRRAEGLSMPGEAPTSATISSDGRTISSDGMPGNWRGSLPPIPSRVWEMNTSQTSLTGKDPEPDYGGVTGGAISIDEAERIRPAEGVG